MSAIYARKYRISLHCSNFAYLFFLSLQKINIYHILHLYKYWLHTLVSFVSTYRCTHSSRSSQHMHTLVSFVSTYLEVGCTHSSRSSQHISLTTYKLLKTSSSKIFCNVSGERSTVSFLTRCAGGSPVADLCDGVCDGVSFLITRKRGSDPTGNSSVLPLTPILACPD